MNQLLYYLFLKPLSMLPLSVLYRLSDGLHWLLFRVLGYRRSVVMANLRRVYPKRDQAELDVIMSNFYRHFFDLIVETLRMFSMPEQEILARCSLRDADILNKYFEQGKGVFIIAGHYNNWEIAAQSANLQLKHYAVGIYSPLKNAFFDKKFYESRARYGLGLVSKKEVNEYFDSLKDRIRPCATMFGADQAPSNPRKAYWMNFLGQETPVFFGPELYAQRYDQVPVFGHIYKLSRGHYEMAFELVEENPTTAPYGLITQRHTRMLEKDILNDPQYWLWTHKRWKRERPSDMEVQPYLD